MRGIKEFFFNKRYELISFVVLLAICIMYCIGRNADMEIGDTRPAMLFNSYEFIFLFIPSVVLLYYFANKITPTFGKLVIIVSSILYYSLGRANMLIYLALSMLINYESSFAIHKFPQKKKLIMTFPIIINVVLLLYFKYLNFAITSVNTLLNSDFPLKGIILPLGISFYTFQQIAYVVSVERGEISNNSFIDYAAYILFFPKLIMGPIVGPVDFIFQLNDEKRKRVNWNNIASGVKLFSFGLLKKMLLADTFSRAVTWIFGNLESATAMDCILLTLFYTLEIYFDFSGYSDMATGTSLLLNIDLPINFDSPYKAISIRDFWKRWHISLTKFLTKYIYIPLGGSRKGTVYTYINTLIVFVISGLWHGANWTFVLWGILHGLLSCLDRCFDKWEEKIYKPIRWLITFIEVNFLWLLFGSESIGQWWSTLKRIFSIQGLSISDGVKYTFTIVESDFIYRTLHLGELLNHVSGINLIAFTLIALFVCFVPENNYKNKDKLGIASIIAAAIGFSWGVLCLGTESIFVYFGF